MESIDMNSTSPEPPKSRNSRFVPFFLILVIAVAIGFAIRHFKGKPQEAIGGTWEAYFSEVYAGKLDENTPHTLDKRLVAKLGSAKEKVDAALYDLDSGPVANALIDAHERGVKVRVFTENKNADKEEIKRLQKMGISVQDDGNNEGLMHHKFIVIDKRYVWTGSYNTTYRGAYTNNNNILWIDSVPLAYNFTQEFRHLFFSGQHSTSSDSDIPYRRVTLGDGTQIFTYFAPKDETIPPLLNEIKSAEKSIYFMAFAFTHDKLGKAIRDRFKSGITVEGVFEQRQIDEHSEYESMKNAGIPIIADDKDGTMHHKVIIIDGKTVITGSYNFSRNAETRNSENLLIIKGNQEIAREYLDEFNRLK